MSNLLDSFTLVCYTSALGFEGVDTSTLNYQVIDMYLDKAALTLTFLQDWSQSNVIKEWSFLFNTLAKQSGTDPIGLCCASKHSTDTG